MTEPTPETPTAKHHSVNGVDVYWGTDFDFVKDGSVDFVLTDPPFNISKKTNFHTYEKNTIHSYQFDANNDESWDTYPHDVFLEKLDEWAGNWNRVLRRGGNFAVFCADSYISHMFEAMKNNGLLPKRLITWRKNNAVPINRAYMPMSANEYIIVGMKKGKTTFNADIQIEEQTIDDRLIESTIVADKVSTIVYSNLYREMLKRTSPEGENDLEHLQSVLEVVQNSFNEKNIEIIKERVLGMYKEKDEKLYLQACVPNYIQNPLKTGKRLHPTEKPTAVLQYLIALYSNPGNLVLDGFGGSGSTGEAAHNMGRKCILVEQDKGFYEKIVNRMDNLSPVEGTINPPA